MLNIPFDGLEYVYNWLLSEPATIGFYGEIDGNKLLPMLAIDGSVAIYDDCALAGTFRTFDYLDVVITTSSTVRVDMTVSAYPPTIPYKYLVPSTKYLEFSYRGSMYKFPVYNLRQAVSF